MAAPLLTPGVSLQELSTSGNSVVPVATAVPAFIGYTPSAEYKGKSFHNKPTKISSFADFQAFFMLPDLTLGANPPSQYNPEYYLVAQAQPPTVGHHMKIAGQSYSILPDPDTIYYLFNSVRLYFLNGGGPAYIVSVGTYGPASKKSLVDPSVRPVNANVLLDDLLNGLDLLMQEQEPTMYICPDATLLPPAANATLMAAMLLQASNMKTAICLLDVIGGDTPDPLLYTQDIDNFRTSTGNTGLSYGVCYYPFIGTTIMQSADLDFTNLFGGDLKQLGTLINPASNPNADAASILAQIQSPPANPLTNQQLQAALLIASPLYQNIVNNVLESANMLPPSAAMAGIYANNDQATGVWNSPANTGIVGCASLPIRLTDSQQASMNVDALTGKSVNAIRNFKGQGILVWGARTLDGNSNDWRYIAVRRTMTFLEQSVKLAASAYMFAPNTPKTWSGVKTMINSFLNGVWSQGGLMGGAPAEAFLVNVGLGSTMTNDDILAGVMKVSVAVALIRPAEFIVITFEQKQAASA